jgi:hypothetical protein
MGAVELADQVGIGQRLNAQGKLRLPAKENPSLHRSGSEVEKKTDRH